MAASFDGPVGLYYIGWFRPNRLLLEGFDWDVAKFAVPAAS
jgi:hypothetical protein